MAIVIEDIFIPFDLVFPSDLIGGNHASYWPLPTRFHKREYYPFATRVFKDSEWVDGRSPEKGTIFYFHGSGSSAPLGIDETSVAHRWVVDGYQVIQPMFWGSWNSPASPFRFGYGNVNAPHYMSHFSKNGYWVEAAYKWAITNLPTDERFLLVGHSMGGSAVLSWSANFSGRAETGIFDPRFKGIIVNGSTVGGLGDYSWNDVIRNLNTLTNMVHLSRAKAIILYADSDAFAPPDYAKRMQMAIKSNRDIYLLSPGDYPHSWFSHDAAARLMISMWCKQLIEDQTITTRDGFTPAIRGIA